MRHRNEVDEEFFEMKSMSDAISPQPPSLYPDNEAYILTTMPPTGATVDIALLCELRRKTDVKLQSVHASSDQMFLDRWLLMAMFGRLQ